MFLLLRYQLKSIAKVFRDREIAQIIVGAAYILLGVLVAFGIFVGSYCGFRFLAGQPSFCKIPVQAEQAYFADAITLYTLELALVLIFAITLLAGIITAASVFFTPRESQWLLSSPLSTQRIFHEKMPIFRLLISWPILIIGLPAIFALGIVQEQGLFFYLASILGLAIYLRWIGALAALASFFILAVFRKLPKYLLLGLAIILVVISGLIIKLAFLPQNLEALFQPEEFGLAQAPITKVEARYLFSPGHPLAEIIFRSTLGHADQVLFWFMMIGVIAILTTILVEIVAKKRYREYLLRLQEGAFIARKEDVSAKKRVTGTWPDLFPGKIGPLLAKDLILIFRNPRELVAAGFLIFLLVIYLSLLLGLPKGEIRQAPFLAGLIALHIAGLGYFAAVLGLRFIFPQIGLEGQHGWIIFASPVSPKTIFFEKFLFSFILLIFLIGGLMIFSLPLFGVGILLFSELSVLGVSLALGLSAIMIGIGAMTPELRRRDPERMSTTPAGLAATLASLAFVLLCAISAFFAAKAETFSLGILITFGVAVLVAFLVIYKTPQVLAKQNF